jgi:hypothetical protein
MFYITTYETCKNPTKSTYRGGSQITSTHMSNSKFGTQGPDSCHQGQGERRVRHRSSTGTWVHLDSPIPRLWGRRDSTLRAPSGDQTAGLCHLQAQDGGHSQGFSNWDVLMHMQLGILEKCGSQYFSQAPRQGCCPVFQPHQAAKPWYLNSS